jgi:predicted ATPase
MGEKEEAAERGAQQNAFIGRTRELSELRGALEESLAGRGSCFLISGEPGIGKTRLADELAADAASRGVRVAWGRCWEGGGAPAYWPWVEIVRALVLEPGRARPQQTAVPPEIGQLIPELAAETTQQRSSSDPEQGRFRLFDAVATLVKQVARATPLVLILDDLHEADRGSLELLKFVARGLTDSRVVIVGTYRDAEVRRSPHLAESISEIVRHGHPMPLAGLAENEVEQMIEHRAERLPSATFASELHRVTAGNPLFVDGVIRVLVAERKLGTAQHLDLTGFKLPEGVRGAIRKRLAILSAEAQSALAIAAVIGPEFDALLLQQVSKLSAEPLAELIREASEVGMVAAASGEIYRFTHPLIREALYSDTADTDRVRLHRATGEALEQIHAANLTPHLAALAHHFNAAGVVEKALDYSIRAGEASQAVCAFEEAAEHYLVALHLVDEAGFDLEQKASVLERLGRLTYFTDQRKFAAYWEKALELYESLNRREGMVAAHVNLAIGFATPSAMMDVGRALEHLEKAEAALGNEPWEEARCWFYRAVSLAAGQAMRTDQALAASKTAMEIADSLGNRAQWTTAADAHALHLTFAGRLKEGRALIERSWQGGRDLVGAGLSSVWNGTGIYSMLHDPRESLRWTLRELDAPRTAHSIFPREITVNSGVDNYLLMGELLEARRLLNQTEPGYFVRAYFALFEGDWEQADSIWTGLLNFCANAGARPEAFTWFRHSVWARRLLRNYSAAEDMLVRGLELCSRETLPIVEMQLRPELVMLNADTGRDADSNSQLVRCREIMSEDQDWLGLAGMVWRAEAIVASAEGRHDEAQAQFQKAIETFQRYRLPWEEAETLLYCGRVLSSAGDSRANQKFDAAIEIYRRHGGGQRWIDRVEAARIELPAAPRSKQRPSDDECLFRREGEFWTIVWHGKTSRLKDAKGLRYIAYMLAHPGVQIHVHDLITVVEGSAVDTQSDGAAHSDGLEIVRDVGGPDPALDSRARSEYGARLRELRTELDEAQRFNDTGRSERLRAEIELVSEELTAGLRRRSSSDNAERARGMVSKRIRATLDKIHDQDPSLSRHFTTSIKTGYFCAYVPDPDHKIFWQM